MIRMNLRARFIKALGISSLVLLLAVTSLPFPQQNPPATGPQAAPVRAPRNHDYDVQNYRIVVSFDFVSRSVAGETTITFRPMKDGLKELDLDAGKMNISRVRLANGAPLKFRYEGGEKLLVALDRQY